MGGAARPWKRSSASTVFSCGNSQKTVLTAFGKASGESMQELWDKGDDITKKICASYFKFRRQAVLWTRIGDQAYANARLLEFPYPTG